MKKPVETEMNTGSGKKEKQRQLCELLIVNIAIGDLFSLYSLIVSMFDSFYLF